MNQHNRFYTEYALEYVQNMHALPIIITSLEFRNLFGLFKSIDTSDTAFLTTETFCGLEFNLQEEYHLINGMKCLPCLPHSPVGIGLYRFFFHQFMAMLVGHSIKQVSCTLKEVSWVKVRRQAAIYKKAHVSPCKSLAPFICKSNAFHLEP